MSTYNQGQVITFTIPPQPGTSSPSSHRSNCLTGFGILELVFAFFLLVWSVWTCDLDNNILASYFGIICAIIHLIVSILAIIGGRNGVKYHGVLIACIVLGVVGSSIFAVVSATTSSIGWITYSYGCNYCRGSSNCPLACPGTVINVMFLLLFVTTLLVAIIGIVVTSISCCNLCYCCGCCFTGIEPIKAYAVYQPGTVYQPGPMYQPGPPPAYNAAAEGNRYSDIDIPRYTKDQAEVLNV